MTFIMLYVQVLTHTELCLPLVFALQEILHGTFPDLYSLNKMLLSFTLKVTLVLLHIFTNSQQVQFPPAE